MTRQLTSPRIKWTQQETYLVAEKVTSLRVECADITIFEAIKRAQQAVLPLERQRRIGGYNSIPKHSPLRRMIDEQWRKYLKTAGLLKPEMAPPEPQPLPAVEQPPTPPQQPEQPSNYEYGPLDSLRDALRQFIQAEVMAALEHVVGGLGAGLVARQPLVDQLPPVQYEQHPVDKTPIPRKSKVLVMGIKNGNQALLTQRFAGALDIEHWHDGNLQELEAKARGKDYVFAAMGSTSHQAFARAQAGHPAAVRVVGGNTTMVTLLQGLVARLAGG